MFFYMSAKAIQHNVTQKTFLYSFLIFNFEARFDEFMDAHFDHGMLAKFIEPLQLEKTIP